MSTDTQDVDGVDTAGQPVNTEAGSLRSAGRLDLLRGVEMSATVELGRTHLRVEEVLGLREGSIVELDRAAGESADLLINGVLIASGEIVVVDENYAIRITRIAASDTAEH